MDEKREEGGARDMEDEAEGERTWRVLVYAEVVGCTRRRERNWELGADEE